MSSPFSVFFVPGIDAANLCLLFRVRCIDSLALRLPLFVLWGGVTHLGNAMHNFTQHLGNKMKQKIISNLNWNSEKYYGVRLKFVVQCPRNGFEFTCIYFVLDILSFKLNYISLFDCRMYFKSNCYNYIFIYFNELFQWQNW